MRGAQRRQRIFDNEHPPQFFNRRVHSLAPFFWRAGLQGIQKGYELAPPTEDDVWSLTETERRAMGYESLPQNLHEALVAMEHSELVAEILGEHVFDFFLRNKRQEWDGYRRQVTPYELATYLPVL
jgi:glutamine synthetase